MRGPKIGKVLELPLAAPRICREVSLSSSTNCIPSPGNNKRGADPTLSLERAGNHLGSARDSRAAIGDSADHTVGGNSTANVGRSHAGSSPRTTRRVALPRENLPHRAFGRRRPPYDLLALISPFRRQDVRCRIAEAQTEKKSLVEVFSGSGAVTRPPVIRACGFTRNWRN